MEGKVPFLDSAKDGVISLIKGEDERKDTGLNLVSKMFGGEKKRWGQLCLN